MTKKPAKKQSSSELIQSSTTQYLTFVSASEDDPNSIEVCYEDENIWMTQKIMAELYEVSIPAINQHISTLIYTGEIDSATIKQYLIVQKEGQRKVKRNQDHYNLQAIISVGFKIKNDRAVQFRKWAKQIVKDYRELLMNGGKISHEEAKLHAETQFEKYRIIQDRHFESDFDKQMKKLLKNNQ